MTNESVEQEAGATNMPSRIRRLDLGESNLTDTNAYMEFQFLQGKRKISVLFFRLISEKVCCKFFEYTALLSSQLFFC
jgi:hypothetical protein